MFNTLTQKETENLIAAALNARNRAYAPYSRYQVGAALLTFDGKIYQGVNVENASYGATNCAERTAFFKAVSEGECEFKAIAVAGGMENTNPQEYAYPCGVCRQVMRELCRSDFQIVVAKDMKDYKIYELSELLPFGFGGEVIR